LTDREPGRNGVWVLGARRGAEVVLLAANLQPRASDARIAVAGRRMR
jgi:hypothetical protein